MPPNRPRFSLADVMLLVGSTGLSLATYVLVDNGLFGGRRFFFGFFQGPTRLDALEILERMGGALSILVILFGGWTIVLPALPLRKDRPLWRRLSRQPGISACIAAVAGMAFWGAVAGGTLWFRGLVQQHAPLPPGFWVRSPVFDGLIVCAGTSVAAVWGVLIATGRWRPQGHAFDRIGRGLGLLWLAVGAVFAARLFLDV